LSSLIVSTSILGLEEDTMKTLWISAFFWLAALSFVVPAQAGPLDIADDSWATERVTDRN
jgi:hypothetical protein